MTEIENIKANFLRRDNMAAMERAEDPAYLERWWWHEEMRVLLKQLDKENKRYSDFGVWWHNEGSAPPLPGEDIETFAHRITRIAWENGDYKATVRAEQHIAELEEAMRRLSNEETSE